MRQQILLFLCFSMGCAKDDKDEAPPIMATFQSETEGQLSLFAELDNVVDCSLDPDTGVFEALFKAGDQQLAIAIRDLAEGDATSECAQSESNFEDREYLGDGYETCAVRVTTQEKVPNGSSVPTSYSLYRDSVGLGLFAAPSGCRMSISRGGGPVAGEFTCESLVQTKLNGVPRNPIADADFKPSATRSFSGSFRCDPMRVSAKDPLATSFLPPVIASGQLTASGAVQKLSYRNVTACTVDSEGSLNVELARNGDALNLAVRDFARSPQLRTCKQASNNGEASTNLGDLFDDCSVRLTTKPSPAGKSEAYAMYRHATTVRPFRYAQSCTVDILNVDTFVRAKVDCKGMAQTMVNGLPRNPVSSPELIPIVTKDLNLEFKCALQE